MLGDQNTKVRANSLKFLSSLTAGKTVFIRLWETDVSDSWPNTQVSYSNDVTRLSAWPPQRKHPSCGLWNHLSLKLALAASGSHRQRRADLGWPFLFLVPSQGPSCGIICWNDFLPFPWPTSHRLFFSCSDIYVCVLSHAVPITPAGIDAAYQYKAIKPLWINTEKWTENEMKL